MPKAAQADVEPARVAAVCLADGQGHGIGALGNRDQVHVVGHQAVAEDLKPCLAGAVGEEGEVGGAILIRVEDVPAKVAALRDVVRAPDGYHALNSCHQVDSGRRGEKISHEIRKRIT